jgi:hypothetical protein
MPVTAVESQISKAQTMTLAKFEQRRDDQSPAQVPGVSVNRRAFMNSIVVLPIAAAVPVASPSIAASTLAEIPGAGLARLEQAVELLRTRYVCEGWKIDEAGAERALRYFRAGCPDDDDEWGATLSFIGSHGLSFDWICCGDVGSMICTLARLSDRAKAIVPADPIFAAIERHRQYEAACGADIPDADGRGDAFKIVMRTRPTTPSGLVALTTWTREQANGGMLLFDDYFAFIATIDDSARGMSGLVAWSPPTAPDSDAELFAAIEHHKAARLAFESAVHRGSKLDEELPSEKTQSQITVFEKRIVETDDPRWIESEREINRTSDAEEEAACALVGIAPSTMPGVIALLRYATSMRLEEWPESLQSDDGTKTGPWTFFLIEMLADTLSDMMAVQGASPAV